MVVKRRQEEQESSGSSILLEMLAKKSGDGERPGAPRWMVTFADLMSLLFALFVLLLSFSEVNSDKFKKNAGPLSQAFHSIVPKEPEPVDAETSKSQDQEADGAGSSGSSFDIDAWKGEIMYNLRTGLATELEEESVEVEERDQEIVIRFPEKTAFASGSAELKREITSALARVAQILGRTDGRVGVAGHTDDVPIKTARFRSNWELSSSRAVSVVHYLLTERELDKKRVSAQGFADVQPLESNDTPEGRARNRRVEVTIQFPTPAKDKVLFGR